MSRLGQLVIGAQSLSTAARLIARTPRLWGWLAVPLLLQLGVCASAGYALLQYWQPFSQWMTGLIPAWHPTAAAWWQWPLVWAGRALYEGLAAMSLLFAVGFLFLAAFLAGQILAGPLLEYLAERVEQQLHPDTLLPAPRSFGHRLRLMGHALRTECLKAVWLLGIPLLLQSLHLIPIAGSLCALIIVPLFSTWALGFTFYDYPLALRHLPWATRWRLAWRQRWTLIGLGLPGWIPGALFIGSPFLVVAGVLLHHEISQQLVSHRRRFV